MKLYKIMNNLKFYLNSAFKFYLKIIIFIFIFSIIFLYYFFSENGKKKFLNYEYKILQLTESINILNKTQEKLNRKLWRLKNIPKIKEFIIRDNLDKIKDNEIYFYFKE